MTTPEQRGRLAEHTLRILSRASYQGPSGISVDLHALMSSARQNATLYTPESPPPLLWTFDGTEPRPTLIEVVGEPLLDGARALRGPRASVVVLTGCSPAGPRAALTEAGRGEEQASVATDSSLVDCLEGSALFDAASNARDQLYDNHRLLYSPTLPVFRDGSGQLLDWPWTCSVIAVTVVDMAAVPTDDRSRARAAMRERIGRAFAVAAVQRHDTVVLGAFGCGAAGHAAADVAEYCFEALGGPFRGVFERVRFSIDQDAATAAVFRETHRRLFETSM